MIVEYLDERKQKVLQIIIEDYVESAEPVGSKTLTIKHHLNASPATIRFDMADLEKKGFIKKPHTSAGRIPSDKGYRFFVDRIMEIEKLNKKQEEFIKNKILSSDRNSLAEVIGNLLSDLSNNVSIILNLSKTVGYYITGISRMLKQPEFNISEHVCDVVETLEHPSKISDILYEYVDELNDLSVHIGSENHFKALKKCSVAVTPFSDKGVIGIIGPTRMNYKKVISSLKHFASIMEEIDL